MNLNKKLLVVALASAFAQSAQAATFTWDCAGPDFWDIQSCWGPNGLPTAADTVQINTPWVVAIDAITGTALASQLFVSGSGQVRQEAGGLTVAVEYLGSGSVGTHTLLGGTHTVTSSLFVGHSGGDGAYTQTGGTLNANTVVIGEGVSKGVASVSNGSWSVTNNVTVGSTNASGYGGQLSVGSGGNVAIGGALTVNRPLGSSSKIGSVSTSGGGVIKVGGVMTLSGGTANSYWGAVDSAGAIFASDMITANGVTVGGAGSLWSTNTLIAGRNGTGTLNIIADGKVTASTGFIAEFAGSTGNTVIGGSNALLQVTNGLFVGGGSSGSGGTGTLTVNSGGKATAGSLTVWNSASSITTGTTASTTGGIIDIAGALTLQGGGKATGYYGYVDGSYAGTFSGIYANSATIGGTSTGSRWDTALHYTGYTGTGTLTVNNGGTLKSSGTVVGTLSGANGTLNINAGGFVDTGDNGHLGFNLGATGAATVDGAGALWDVNNGLYVGGTAIGSGGTGTLTVKTGGKVKAGSLTVWNGASSITTGTTTSDTGGIIDIAGALTLQGGGKATGYFGYVDGSYAGTSSGIYANGATIGGTGTDSRWDTAFHYTGFTGTGILNVNSGGTLKSSGTVVGTLSGANGTLNINAGGFVDTDGNGYLGHDSGATGAATVGGAGSRWDTTTHYTGLTGTGTLTVNSGGTVKSTSNTFVGTNSGANGTLNINADGIVDTGGNGFMGFNSGATGAATVGGAGALWDVGGGLYVGGNDLSSGGTGTLTVNSGGTVTAGSLTVWNSASSIKTGTTAGTIDIAGALTLQGGGKATGYFGSVDNIASTNFGIHANTATIGNGIGDSRWETAYHHTGFSGTGTLTVNNGGTVASTVDTYVGTNPGANGTLNINAGGFVDTEGSGYLGALNGATGTATVGGTGAPTSALWDVTNGLYVGGNNVSSGGTGILTVNSGGTVKAGSLTVWNSASSITTGTTASSTGGIIDIAGALTLQGGGKATGYFGYVDGSYADTLSGIYADSATIGGIGTGSRWETVRHYTGFTGTGTLTVNSGGTLKSSVTVVGTLSGANGTLNINAGGLVDTDGDGFLGFNSGATGAATVDGAGALWDVGGGLYVGGNDLSSGGTGTLTVTTGGTVTAGGVFKLWSTGTLNLNGGTLNVGSLDMLDNSGAFNFNAGTVNVTNNLSLNGFGTPGSLVLGKFDTMTVGGATTLNDFSTLDINGGTFSTGSLVDNGGFAFNSGTFNLTGSNLVIGAGGLFGGNVEFDASRTVNVANTVTINSGAILGLNNAAFSAGTYANNGTVDLAGSVTVAGGTVFSNSGILTGNGTIGAVLANNAAGQVRAVTGDTLTFTGTGNTNAGLVNLLGGTAAFNNGLTNAAGGLISGHGALIATGGLTNNGTLATTAVTDIQGDVTNGTNGHIVIAGTTTTFYDDVVHNGAEFKVNNGAQAVFFGSYSGAGSFTGTGELVFAGDLMPGNSPALVDVQGDLTLLSSVVTTMELGGLTRGTQYDAFAVGGTLSLDGTLAVVLYDLGSGVFTPQAGDSFDLFAATTIQGNFSALNFAALNPGLTWNIVYLTDAYGSTDVVRLDVQAVPEAETYLMMLAGLGLVGAMARRRQRAQG